MAHAPKRYPFLQERQLTNRKGFRGTQPRWHPHCFAGRVLEAPEENTVSHDFRIGEKAVYPAHGVAEVIGIEKKEINTSVCAFYVLKVLATGMQILVPKEKADQVGLRHVASASEIDEVFDILREKDVHIDKQTWNRSYRGFMEKIKTGSLFGE